MTRVSTAGQNTLLLVDVLKQQTRIFETQKQVTSGYKSQDYQGIASDVVTLQGAKSVLSKTEQFLQTNTELRRVTELQNLSLEGISDIATELKTKLISSLNAGSGIGLRDEIDTMYNSVVNYLTVQDNGRYLFGGTRTDVPPISANTSAELEALGAGNAAQAFENNSLKPQARIDDNLTLTYGVLASDAAGPLVQLLQDLMIFATTNGAFSNPLSNAERDFIISKVPESGVAFDQVNLAQAQHGVVMKRLEEVEDRHISDKNFLTNFIGDIEEVDVAAAVSRLQQDQVSLEASFRVFAQLNNLSLLNFL